MFRKGVDINLCFSDGVFFFYVVSLNGYYDIVIFLLNSCVNINLCMENGDSFFYVVCFNGYYCIV